MTATIQDRVHAQVQTGIDNRLTNPTTSLAPELPVSNGTARTRAARRMLGIDRDRTSVEDDARAAYTPTGPPLTVLEAGIRSLRHEYGVPA